MPAKNASVAALGRAVRTIRIERGLSQEEAGSRAGIGRSFYGRVERGEASPTYETILKLADGFEIGAAEIVALAERYRRASGRGPQSRGPRRGR